MDQTTESGLLQLLLAGEVDADAILPWAVSSEAQLDLPTHLADRLRDEGQPSNTGRGASPAVFRATVLNLVREEADHLYACLEAASEAAATPRASDARCGPSGTPAARPRQGSVPASHSGFASCPGTVDDLNFPSLGSVVPNKERHAKLPAGALMRMVNSPNPDAQQQGSAGSATSRTTSQNRIAPTAVTSVVRDARFVEKEKTTKLQQSGQPRKIAPMKMEATENVTAESFDSQRRSAANAWGRGGSNDEGLSTSKAASEHSGSSQGFRDALLRKAATAEPGARDQQRHSAADSCPDCWVTEAQTSSTATSVWVQAGAPDLIHSSPGGPEGAYAHTAWDRRMTGKSTSPASSRGSTKGPGGLSPSENQARGMGARAVASKPQDPPGSHMRGGPRKGPRSRSASPLSFSASPEIRNPGRANWNSPSPTPQSRFRPTFPTPDQTPGTGDVPSVMHLAGGRELQSRGAGSPPATTFAGAAGVSLPQEPASASASGRSTMTYGEGEYEGSKSSFEGLQIAGAAVGGVSPRTPTFSAARQAWKPRGSGPSPQGSVYFTASEAESPTSTESPVLAASPGAIDSTTARSAVHQRAPPPKPLANPQQPDDSVSPATTKEAGFTQIPVEEANRPSWKGLRSQGVEESEVKVAADQGDTAGTPVALHKDTARLEGSTGRQLGAAGHTLALLHSHLIGNAAAVNLSAEVNLLFQLLALPEGVTQRGSSDEAREPLFPSGDAASHYACKVLEGTGNLVHAFDAPLLEAMHGQAAIEKHSPGLAETCSRALEEARRMPTRGLKLPASSGLKSMTLLAFNSDGLAKRTPEEQRRVSNRELCRDELLTILREASTMGQSFTNSTPKNAASPAAGTDDAAFMLIQQKAPALLRKVSHENFGHMAELFTAAVLQAAATGEAVLDKELGSLAQQNVSKFQQLNQRLQAPLSRQSRLQSSPASSAASNPASKHAGKYNPARSQALRGAQDHTASALRVAAEFPQALKLYVLFLEAADSHRLNCNLRRCMAVKLQQLVMDSQEQKMAGASFQHVLATAALAIFLSYLCFAAGSGQDWRSEAGATPEEQLASPAVDVMDAMSKAISLSHFARTAQWVARFLWFLPSDPASANSKYFRAAVASLACIRRSPSLQPSAEGFTVVHLCVRGVLDGLVERVGQLGDPGARGDLQLPTDDDIGSFDGRLMSLCCPLLEQARLALQAQAAGTKKHLRPSRIQKLTPSVPPKPPAIDVPEEVKKAAAGCVNPDMLRLQHAFLNMYSTSEHKLKLRDVVAYIAEVVGLNTVASCLEVRINPVVTRLAQRLEEQAAEACEKQRTPPPVEALQAHLLPLTEELVAEAIPNVLSESMDKAEKYMHEHVTTAMAALRHPTWTDAIAGTAAAIALESARASCATQLIQEVPGVLRVALTAKASEAARAAARHARQKAAASLCQ